MRQNPTITAYAGRIAGHLRTVVKQCAQLFDRAAKNLGLKTSRRCNPTSDNVLKCPMADTDNLSEHSLDCAVAIEQGPAGEEVFTLRIRGKISADNPGRRVYLTTKFDDVTSGDAEPAVVYLKPHRNLQPPSRPFEYVCDLGTLNRAETQIDDWLSVARVNPGQMVFARRGKRLLRIRGAVLSCETNNPFARCICEFSYDNNCWGYLDLAENVQRSNALGVTLAFALSAADGRMYKCEIDAIKAWACRNLAPQESKSTKRQLGRALRRTVRFFRAGHKVDPGTLAAQLAEIAPPAQRYDIVEMCLKVLESKGFLSAGQITMLKTLSASLELDPRRFREMLDRLAPASTHQVKDMELIFGLNAHMDLQQSRKTLNNEYRKWNSRVTSMDPSIKSQAEQMLQLIAEARGRQAV